MNRSKFKAYIREEIKSTLSENVTSSSNIEKYISVLKDIIAKVPSRKVKAKAGALISDLLDYSQGYDETLEEASKEEVKNQQDLNVELAKTVELTKNLKESDDEDVEDDEVKMDKQASKLAKKGDSVSKLASKLSEIDKEMKSTVKKWKDSEEPTKSKLLNRLKELTKIKKELNSALGLNESVTNPNIKKIL
jgi:hypothetical protein